MITREKLLGNIYLEPKCWRVRDQEGMIAKQKKKEKDQKEKDKLAGCNERSGFPFRMRQLGSSFPLLAFYCILAYVA